MGRGIRRGVGVVLGCVLLLGGAARAMSGQDLSEDQLEVEMARNRALEAYVGRNGLPDVAESRFLSDRPPWDDYEVALYYLDRRLEISFARAYVLGKPEVQITRYERRLTDQQVAALAGRTRLRSTPRMDGTGLPGAAERAEASARRAEDAARRIEAAVPGVEQAASRAEAVVSKMQTASAGDRR